MAGTRAAANAAGAAAALVTGPLLARGLGVEDRGEVAAITAPLLLGIVLLSSASGEVMIADIATRRRTAREVYFPCLVIASSMATVLVVALVALSPVLLVDYENARSTLVVLAFSLFIVAYQATARALRQAERRYALVTREAWSIGASRVVMVAALYVTGTLSVTTAAVAIMAAFILPIVVLHPLRAPFRWRSARFRFSTVLAQQSGKSLRALPGSVATQLNLRLDQIVLAALASPRQLGLYAVAVSIAELPLIGTSAVRQLLLPEAADRGDQELIARACRMVVLVMLPLVLVGVVVIGPFLHVVFGSPFVPAQAMGRVLLVATLVGAPAGFLTTGLVVLGRPGRASIPALLGLASTAVLLPVLATRYGGVGAAWTSLCSYALTTATAAILFARATGHSPRSALVPRAADVRDLRARMSRSGKPGYS